MARFKAEVWGYKAEDSASSSASRLGTSGAWSHTRGWNLGVEVRGYINPTTGEDEFEVWTTGGSSGTRTEKYMLGTLTPRGFLHAPPPR